MNIFKRKMRNTIEGYTHKELLQHLEEDMYASIVYDNILLSNLNRIKCVRNYYRKDLTGVPARVKTCQTAQVYFGIECKPYHCISCHRIMINKKNNKEVFPR